jgi:hypothetical protein
MKARAACETLTLACGLLGGCNGPGGNASALEGGTLCAGWSEPGIAFAPSFDDFHSWASAPAAGPDGTTDGLHGAAPMRIYYNAAPPRGASAFPLCTIIVKETEEADVTKRTVFAMVKRGGEFNSPGAVGWEWFSLQNATDGSVNVLWRTTPLTTDTYRNQPIGDCNGCHGAAKPNDYVWDTALQLTSF